MEKEKIYLLDLNYTLAKRIAMNTRNFSYDVSKDEYRQDLVDSLRGKRIILITARTDNYQNETIKKIQLDTKLNIEKYYFKPYTQRYKKAHEFKREILQILLNEGYIAEDFYGIESNANTREEYKKLGVQSCSYEDFMKKHSFEQQRLF